ncbi:hypothetical protein Efla_001883 [Eimeria flavescens]
MQYHSQGDSWENGNYAGQLQCQANEGAPAAANLRSWGAHGADEFHDDQKHRLWRGGARNAHESGMVESNAPWAAVPSPGRAPPSFFWLLSMRMQQALPGLPCARQAVELHPAASSALSPRLVGFCPRLFMLRLRVALAAGRPVCVRATVGSETLIQRYMTLPGGRLGPPPGVLSSAVSLRMTVYSKSVVSSTTIMASIKPCSSISA